jgi:hypothetical protein
MWILFLCLSLAFSLGAADSVEVFGRKWSVPKIEDWKVEGGTLHLVQGREPLPGPRRPYQFAIADTEKLGEVTVEADVKPGGRSVMIVFAYHDAAHFDYAHISTDTGTVQPHHNGIFHVYEGERVRISKPAGRASFAASGRWYHVKLAYSAGSGRVRVLVDGQAVPALDAVDVSLGAGKVGIGSFDETGSFKNVTISGK